MFETCRAVAGNCDTRREISKIECRGDRPAPREILNKHKVTRNIMQNYWPCFLCILPGPRHFVRSCVLHIIMRFMTKSEYLSVGQFTVMVLVNAEINLVPRQICFYFRNFNASFVYVVFIIMLIARYLLYYSTLWYITLKRGKRNSMLRIREINISNVNGKKLFKFRNL